MPTVHSELYRLARELALDVTADAGEAPPSLGLVAITEDIARHRDTTVGEVAARTGLAQSLVSKTVSELREAGVVVSRRDEADRRRSRIAVTDAARSRVFAARGARDITDALRERFPELSAARIAAVEALLERLAAELAGTESGRAAR